ncbi:MAG TPA: class I SAM-dependent methyltransferase [Candidatus Polarisedimenticolia bacterium]|jgi:cyclopropane fatty-acyl-phospholipid synthase-like methyltransferase
MNEVAELFDGWARSGRAEGMERGHAPAARMALDRLGLRDSSTFLDIGCGNGYVVRWAASAAPLGRAVGIDLSGEMIARARILSTGCPNAEFAAGSFPEIDPPGAPYDAIFSMEVFYYLPDLGAALRRVRELLRPGGSFACVVDYYAENAESHSWPSELGVPMKLLDAAGWADAFRRGGLTVIDQRRLRVRPEEATAAWKAYEGSLMTLGCR